VIDVSIEDEPQRLFALGISGRASKSRGLLAGIASDASADPSFEGRQLPSRTPILSVPMKMLTLECLRCGDTRDVLASARLHAGECERCEYVGWALVADLTEKLRRVLRERPPERRRLYAA